ncbi:hypothetical protein [Sporosarcina sp. P16b]|uniref:hypothetical protein n=1 Tax=Sporosarcina sp. P16b TaxID=2048261 RepID=UPI001181B798|nr:hypothetical protein [Sporosarcina sp. P16b]
MGILISIAMGFSIFITFFSLFFAVVKRSWRAMLISFIASLPISIYLAGIPSLFFIIIAPIILLSLTLLFRVKFKERYA